jgi:hypothetical protein
MQPTGVGPGTPIALGAARNAGGLAMLRITTVTDSDSERIIKLEGKLVGPWVDEVRRACEARAAPPARVRLDLAALSFVDAAGARLLRELMQGGVAVGPCTGFVAALLKRESP